MGLGFKTIVFFFLSLMLIENLKNHFHFNFLILNFTNEVHVEPPMAGSRILVGIFLKLKTYDFSKCFLKGRFISLLLFIF